MDNIFYLILMWAGALVCVIIGIYATKRKKPMWLWTGSKITEDKVTNVSEYNRANGKMWCCFSIPLWICGVLEFFSPVFSLVFFALTCTVGIGGIVWCYHKIEEKYILK